MKNFGSSVLQSGESKGGNAKRNWRSAWSYHKGSFKSHECLDFFLEVVRSNRRVLIRG